MATIMAFAASEALAEKLNAITQAQQVEPSVVHREILREIHDLFIDEVLTAYFNGPIDAVGAEGSVVNMILRGVGVISKAGRSLAMRLLEKLEPEDQTKLVEHFQKLQYELDGKMHIAFAFTPTEAERAKAVFAQVAEEEEVELDGLIEVLHSVAEGATGNFLDGTVAALKLGRFSRGLVKATQATIRKSTATAIDKGVPALGRKYRKDLAAYYKEMLFDV
ncbi:MAG TPA: hypothetical protein VK099_06770 [Alcanivoracaceae bacterium]|nr:hypothetical protein [Alcanivoracaceae bacterium]